VYVNFRESESHAPWSGGQSIACDRDADSFADTGAGTPGCAMPSLEVRLHSRPMCLVGDRDVREPLGASYFVRWIGQKNSF